MGYKKRRSHDFPGSHSLSRRRSFTATSPPHLRLTYPCGQPYRKNLNNWTVCYVVGLSSPSKVMKFSFFFSVLEWGKGLCFCCVFCPLSGERNSGLHSTPSNYSSFYGTRYGRTLQQDSARSSPPSYPPEKTVFLMVFCPGLRRRAARLPVVQ